MNTKYKFLSGDVNWKQYGGKLISKKLNNGDWDYYLVMEIINMHDATGDEDQPRYNVSIQAVSPTAAAEKLDAALGCCGIETDIESCSDKILVEALSEYGVFAQLWNRSGNNLASLMKEARKESSIIEFMFGFYMDKRGNGIGQTGWNLIAGQDVIDFFKEHETKRS